MVKVPYCFAKDISFGCENSFLLAVSVSLPRLTLVIQANCKQVILKGMPLE